jgi:hypothetical protein
LPIEAIEAIEAIKASRYLTIVHMDFLVDENFPNMEALNIQRRGYALMLQNKRLPIIIHSPRPLQWMTSSAAILA